MDNLKTCFTFPVVKFPGETALVDYSDNAAWLFGEGEEFSLESLLDSSFTFPPNILMDDGDRADNKLHFTEKWPANGQTTDAVPPISSTAGAQAPTRKVKPIISS